MDFEKFVRKYSQNHDVFFAGGIPWRKYKGVLRPLSVPHVEPQLSSGEMRRLLKQAKVPLAIWTYDFDIEETEWWWVIGKRPYSLACLRQKARYNIRHGLKRCSVQRISGSTLANTGYGCYKSAMRRHTETMAFNELTFKKNMADYDLNEANEIWGIFRSSRLVGYAVYQVIENVVREGDTMFDPEYFKHHISHALIHTTKNHYLNERGCKYIASSMRSVSHETQFPDFIISTFGYRRAYCRLGLEASLLFRVFSDAVCCLHPVWKSLPLPAPIKNKLTVLHRLNEAKSSTLKVCK